MDSSHCRWWIIIGTILNTRSLITETGVEILTLPEAEGKIKKLISNRFDQLMRGNIWRKTVLL
jgi:hypothetical protein